MAALIMVNDREPRDTSSAAGAGLESQIRDDELYRMAAFRIRETANRITTLANSAQDEHLRRELLTVCERLLKEERDLLFRTGRR
jgi:hypothetical protein